MRAFLTRRYTLDAEPRRRPAGTSPPRVAGAPPRLGNERFLELLSTAKGAPGVAV